MGCSGNARCVFGVFFFCGWSVGVVLTLSVFSSFLYIYVYAERPNEFHVLPPHRTASNAARPPCDSPHAVFLPIRRALTTTPTALCNALNAPCNAINTPNALQYATHRTRDDTPRTARTASRAAGRTVSRYTTPRRSPRCRSRSSRRRTCRAGGSMRGACGACIPLLTLRVFVYSLRVFAREKNGHKIDARRTQTRGKREPEG